MRKVFLCCMIVIMLICCAVPTFAIGESASENTVYPILSFDYVHFTTSDSFYTFPYPFGDGVGSSRISDFDYFDVDDFPYAFGYQGTGWDDDNVYRLSGDLSFVSPNPYSFDLVAYDKVIDVASLTDEFKIIYPLEHMRINNTVLYVEYYVKTKSASGDRWIFEKRTASWTEGYFPNEVIDVPYSFRRIAAQAGSNDIFVSYMKYTVNYRMLDSATPSFDFIVRCTDDYEPNADFNTWAYMQDLETEEVFVTPPAESLDIWSWLMDTIEHFVELEIFPGFSINKLFWLVLVIGVMLWFITLLI